MLVRLYRSIRARGTLTSRLQHSVVKYGAASIVPRFFSIATAVALLPLGIESLGVTKFGIFVLATQIPSLVVSPDLGMGQGIINELIKSRRERASLDAERRRLAGLSKLLGLVAVGWLAIGVACAATYSYALGTATSGQIFFALFLALACYIPGIPATLWQRVQLAEEAGHRGVIAEGLGRAAAFAACILCLYLLPNVNALIVAFMAPPTIALWLNATLCRRKLGWRRTKIRAPSFRESWHLNRTTIRTGSGFVVMQLGYLLSTALDPYLIAAFLSVQSVTEWTVVKRPFDIMPMAVALYSTALWPVFTRLLQERHVDKLRSLLRSTLLFAFIAIAVASTALFLAREPLYDFLGRGAIEIRLGDLAWLSLATLSATVTLVLTNFLNADGAIRHQAVLAAVGAFAMVICKLSALQYGDIHTFIKVYSMSVVAFSGVPIALLALRRLSRL